MKRLLAVALVAASLFFSISTARSEDVKPDAPPPDDVVINIDRDINSSIETVVADAVKSAVDAKAKHLTIRLNSPGGSIARGMSIIRTIRESGIPTTCIVDDYAFSMAAVILQSSACGERVIHANSIIMFHGTSTGVEGNQRSVQNDIESTQAMNTATATIVCARTGWTLQWYLSEVVEKSKELWMVGDEALAKHVVDRVLPVEKPTVVAPAAKAPN